MWERASTNVLGWGEGGGGDEKLKNIVMWGSASTILPMWGGERNQRI